MGEVEVELKVILRVICLFFGWRILYVNSVVGEESSKNCLWFGFFCYLGVLCMRSKSNRSMIP
jgi:hypothetical protein